jgi:methylated-DNA-[protein]-cysteine S-methyltransferase
MVKDPRDGSFESRCYRVLRRVPKGRVTTYSAIAKVLGSKAYRAVGTAMRKNRNPAIPCHRVVCSDGRVGEYNRGMALKMRILKREGIRITRGVIDLRIYGVNPKALYK